MLQSQKLIFFILLIVATKFTATEAIIQEETDIIIDENECRIETKSISSDCPVGSQDEKEWNVNNRVIAILEKGKPLNCIEPCKNLLPHAIWFNCTSLKYLLLKYTHRCTKDNRVVEIIFPIRAIIQKLVPSFPNLTSVTPGPQTKKIDPEKNTHIGIFIFLGFAVPAALVICLGRSLKHFLHLIQLRATTLLLLSHL
ncbi:uncharacterized protein [Heterodontus francisci]|uniref:uncharacterized protein isoform X2 n=1 Tax=Heterodontus francisci TaxID=7792 RepID=UPI00355B826B